MRLRQAKKIMGWCKGEGNSRSKDHRESFGGSVINFALVIMMKSAEAGFIPRAPT